MSHSPDDRNDKDLPCEYVLLQRFYHSGDEAALEEIYSRYGGWAFFHARLSLNSLQDVEEVVDECFLAVILKCNEYKPTYSFGTWFGTILRGKIIDRLRYNSKRKSADCNDFKEPSDKRPDPLRQVEILEDLRQISRSIDQLPDVQKEIFLSWLKGEKYSEIADHHNRKPAHIRKTVSRIRHRLALQFPAIASEYECSEYE